MMGRQVEFGKVINKVVWAVMGEQRPGTAQFSEQKITFSIQLNRKLQNIFRF